MEYELISDEEFDNLPEDNDRCFVEFERICRKNMTRMMNSDTSTEFDNNLRQQYMSSVAAVARECGIRDVFYDPEFEVSISQMFGSFSLLVQGEVARIRIRQRGERHPYSVLLTPNTRTTIDHYISRIRELIKTSDMEFDKRRRLEDKLDELSKELLNQRLSFAKTMTVLVAITTVIAGVTTIAADGQNAIAHIMQLIGKDKESEEAATARLSPPQKVLPAPERRSATTQPPTRRTPTYDLDDDIPF